MKTAALLLLFPFMTEALPADSAAVMEAMAAFAAPGHLIVPDGADGFSVVIHSDDATQVEMSGTRWRDIRNVVFAFTGEGAWLLLERGTLETVGVFLGRRNEGEVWPLIEAVRSLAATHCGCEVSAEAVY